MARVVIPGFRKIEVSGGGEGGTTNYNDLENKPSINNVPVVGNLNTVELKLTDATLTEEGVPAEAKTVGDKLTAIGFETGPCTLTFGKFDSNNSGKLLESCEVTGMYLKIVKMCFVSLSNVTMSFPNTSSTKGKILITDGIPYPAANPNNVLGYIIENPMPVGTENPISYWQSEINISAPSQFKSPIEVSGSKLFCLEAIYEIAD